jgi:O-antigen/teichoic acid export membrane protein
VSEESPQSTSLDSRSHLGLIAKQFVVYGFGGIAEKLVGFLLLPLYTNYLNADAYGVLVRALLICALVSLLISGGMHAALIKFYADAPDARRKVSAYATILAFVWVATPFVALFLASFAPFLSECLLGSRAHANLLYLVILYLPFGMTNDIAATCFRAMQRSKSFVVLSFARFLFSLVLNIVFIVGLGYGIAGVLWSAIIVNVASALAVQPFLLKGVGFHPDYRKLTPIIRYGLPLMPFTIFEFIMYGANVFIIGWFCNQVDVGVFSIAYKLGLAVFFFFSLPFDRMWTAYVFDLAKKPEGPRVWARVLTYLMLAVTAASLVVVLFVPEVLHVMTRKPAYWAAAPLVPVIVLAQVFYVSTRVFNGGLLVTGATEILSVFTMVGFVVNILANLVLIYLFGPMGAAAAMLVTQIVMASMSYWVNQRALPVSYEWKRIVVPLLLACALFALGQLQGPERLWAAVVVHSLLLAAFPVCLLLMGFFTPGEKAAAKEWIGRAGAWVVRPLRRSAA